MAVTNETGRKKNVVEPEDRKPAPKMDVSITDIYTDERKQILDKHAADDPENFYFYEKRSVDADTLAAKNASLVQEKGAEGLRNVHHKGDVLCRRPMSEHIKEEQMFNRLSERAVEDMADAEGDMTKHRQPKKPKG